MSFKKHQQVRFRTRAGSYTGKVQSTYNTARGDFVVVKCDDGVERKIRPGVLSAA